MKISWTSWRWLLALLVVAGMAWGFVLIQNQLASEFVRGPKDFLEARTQLQRALGVDPEHGEAGGGLAARRAQREFLRQASSWEESLHAGDYQHSRQQLEAMAENYPSRSGFLLDRAVFHLILLPDPKLAARDLVELLKLYEDKSATLKQALNAVLGLYRELHDWRGGLDFLELLASQQSEWTIQQLLVELEFNLQAGRPANELWQQLASHFGELTQLEAVRAYALKTQLEILNNQMKPAVEAYESAEILFASLIQERMREGLDIAPLTKDLELLQRMIAKALIEWESWLLAEAVLLKLAERSPADPELVRMLDYIRMARLDVSSG